ncbi:hypothetical protein GOP47_0007021 [Adiantum capillus-veneris]|uniref:Uncharacterized protein n=1 Tax=Adiantum capillus-veneris TaxID=13818 RepID=A0A9D4ZKI1_ADICA|nr:hypothetical protein GOP47_0007021 [Adiantum capillus-veneris]
MEVSMLGVLPMALKAAVELNVMDILAQHAGAEAEGDGYLSAAQIAAHLEGRTASVEEAASALDRILRVLASYGLLASTTKATGPKTSYGLPAATSRFLRSTSSTSIAPFVLLLQHPVFWQTYNKFHTAVLHGGDLFARVHGLKAFSLIQTDAAFNQLFHHAMLALSHLVMNDLLAIYHGFQAFRSIVDVGGGLGACLSLITSKYPHIKGTNFDLPHVVAGAPTYPGVEHVGGDMFEAIPKSEAIFMKHILHCWSDDNCVKILTNCLNSLPIYGKVIFVEAVLPKQVEQDSDARASYNMDLVMLAFPDGGKERTKEEFEALSLHAGFSNLQVVCSIHGLSVMEISKT